MMKRILSLLLALALFLPVLALGEQEIGVEDLEIEDYEVDENGNLIVTDEETGEAYIIGLDLEKDEELIEQFEVDETIDYSTLELNENLPDNVINILLIGVDVRGNKKVQLLKDQMDPDKGSPDVKLSDVVMILSINKDDGSLKLSSIARDTYVEIPGQGKHKINYSFGIRHFKDGKYVSFTDMPELTVRTVNHNFDMNIQYYLATNFFGVEEIVEYLGGVDLELTKAEAKAINTYLSKNAKKIANSYDNHAQGRKALKAEAGVQHLDGLQALMYARLRHIKGQNDLQRTGRTRKLLEALLKKVMEKMNSGETDALNLAVEFFQYFKTNMNLLTMLNELLPVVFTSLTKLDKAASLISEFRIPVDGKWNYSSDGSYIVLNTKKDNTEALHEFIYDMYYPADE